MKKEKIQQFTLRITNSNRTELIAVMYDMIDAYFEDAAAARASDDREEFKKNVRGADRVVKELSDILDFKYEISGNLYALYTWCRKELSLTMTRYDLSGIELAKRVLTPLGESFRELAKKDTGEPMMRNAERVTAGITYGRSDVAESIDAASTNRGYFA